MIDLRLDAPEQATPSEAAAVLERLFPTPGTYLVRSPVGTREYALSQGAAAIRDQPLMLWRTLFPVPGHYFVKATEGARFQEWWLERLLQEAQRAAGTGRTLMRRALVRFLEERSGRLVAPAFLAQLEERLFDLRQAAAFLMGAPMPPATVAKLAGLGFTEAEVFDFLALAYRLGRIESTLPMGAAFSWPAALELARTVPLTAADEAGLAVARLRAAQYLTPTLLRDGSTLAVEAAEHERMAVRARVAGAIESGESATALARRLYKELEGEGQAGVRDWLRVARTEIQEARVQGAFEAERALRQWTGATHVYRVVAAVPCDGCILLYKNPDGSPRLYTVAELEAADGLGFNRGPWRTWHARIGPTHPNCLCSPWRTWVSALVDTFAIQAPRWRETIERRRIFEPAGGTP